MATQRLPRSPGQPFYERLNQVLGKAGFDAFVEGLCARFYADACRTAESAARTILLDAVGLVLRGTELGTDHRQASGRFDEPARISGLGTGGDAAESLDLVAYTVKDRCGGAP